MKAATLLTDVLAKMLPGSDCIASHHFLPSASVADEAHSGTFKCREPCLEPHNAVNSNPSSQTCVLKAANLPSLMKQIMLKICIILPSATANSRQRLTWFRVTCRATTSASTQHMAARQTCAPASPHCTSTASRRSPTSSSTTAAPASRRARHVPSLRVLDLGLQCNSSSTHNSECNTAGALCMCPVCESLTWACRAT